MTRSTAGVGLDPPRWLPQLRAADEVTPALYCAAGGLAGYFDPSTGLAGAPVPHIASTIGQHPDRLRRHLRTLGDLGWTEVARPAGPGGRGRFALYGLVQPALIAVSTLAGGGFPTAKPPPPEGAFEPVSTLAGGGFPAKDPSQKGGFAPPLLNSARANMNLNVHLRDEVAEAVLEHGLPAVGRDVEWLLEGVDERLAEGVPAPELIARFRQRYVPTRPNGYRSAKGAFMALTKDPLSGPERAAAGLRTTPTPTAPAFIAPDTADALPPDELAARIAAFRSARRVGAAS